MLKNLISWVGTATSIVGSFAIAFGLVQLGYSLFIVGSASWLYVGFANRDRALITLNGVFFIANLIGLYRAFA